MTYFSFLPLIKVTGKTELPILNSPVLDKLFVSDSQIKFKLKNLENSKDIILVNFDVKPGLHYLDDEIENLPLELSFTSTIDFLDGLSTKFDLSTILMDDQKENFDFVETFLFFSDKVYLPFQVRRPSTKTLFSSVFTIMPIKSNLMSPIEVMSDQYEDYIENALYSFLLNVSKPLREKEHEELINSRELLKVLDRIEDLSQILTGQIDNIRERYRAFSRIMVPLIQLANIKKKISDSISINVSKNTISYKLQYPREVSSDDIAEYISNRLSSEQ